MLTFLNQIQLPSMPRRFGTSARTGTLPATRLLTVAAVLLTGIYSAPALAHKKQGISLFEPDGPHQRTEAWFSVDCVNPRHSQTRKPGGNQPIDTDIAGEAHPLTTGAIDSCSLNLLDETMNGVEQKLEGQINTSIQQHLQEFHMLWLTRGVTKLPLCRTALIANSIFKGTPTETPHIQL